MPYPMTQVLLSRTFDYTHTDGTVTQVKINFGTPADDPPTDPGDAPGYYCPIQLIGFQNNSIYAVPGEDALDAIIQALVLAPTLIGTSSIGNHLDLDATINYGFPTFDVPLDGNTVSGTVQLEACNDPAQNITFEFRTNDGNPPTVIHQILTPVSADTGSFSIPGVPDGTYDLAIKGFCWPRQVLHGVVVAGADVSGLSASLLGGDINNDNVIDTSDFNLLSGEFGQMGDP